MENETLQYNQYCWRQQTSLFTNTGSPEATGNDNKTELI